jgi:DNA-binding transcriptional ArsR family regulator
MVYHPTVLDRTFAALADPTRRAILSRLAAGDRTISELAAKFDMTLPAVSKHVRVLERAGLAQVRREGRVRRTTLVAAPMRDAAAWIERYRQFWDFQFDQLAHYLEAASPEHSNDTEETPVWPRPPEARSKPHSRSGESSKRPGTASSKRGRGPKT